MSEEIFEKEFVYKCKNYNSRLECKNCDGFGRNSSEEINTEKCYKPVNKNKRYDLSEESNLLSYLNNS